jgi:hypothetical protein
LIAGGLDVVTVQRQADHARPPLSLDRYAGEFEKAQRIRDNVRSKVVASGFGAKI